MKISKELLKGSTTMLILRLLKEKPMYGYEMIKAIEQKSKGVFDFKEGTIYPILHGLENDGYVEAYWEESSKGRKRKYYKITKTGLGQLEENKKEWKIYKTAVDNCILEVAAWE